MKQCNQNLLLLWIDFWAGLLRYGARMCKGMVSNGRKHTDKADKKGRANNEIDIIKVFGICPGKLEMLSCSYISQCSSRSSLLFMGR